MKELNTSKVGSLYRLIYDYFEGLEIPSQEARLKAYIASGEKAKAFIAKLILIRITGVYGSYWEYYNDVKDLPVEKEALNEIEAEIKRGFFKKNLVFNGEKLVEV